MTERPQSQFGTSADTPASASAAGVEIGNSRTVPPKNAAEPMNTAAPNSAEPQARSNASDEHGGSARWSSVWADQAPSWLSSFLFHLLLLLVLFLWVIPGQPSANLVVQSLSHLDNEDLEDIGQEILNDVKLEASADATALESNVPTPEHMENPDSISLSPADITETATIEVPTLDFSEQMAPKADLLSSLGTSPSGQMNNRSGSARGQALSRYGGNSQSETAVDRALNWLVEHQFPDGGWSFDHASGPCNGRCDHTGSFGAARNGATGMALLPFLGAGMTHQEGKYKKSVESGMYYLLRSMKVEKNRGSLYDQGNMYSQGLAAIALCEAYAMTHDPALREPAQRAINYIQYVQDPRGGGWRYTPRRPGDTSVLGWQIMALKSAYMGYLDVDPKVIHKASRFLDSVQSNGGATYGYMTPTTSPGYTTSAVGLLCRMHTGWQRDHPALTAGVERIAWAVRQ